MPQKPHHTTRILGRRYPLTQTWYKHVEIGISVGPVSYVEIVLADNRGNQMPISYQTWKELMKKRLDIEQLQWFLSSLPLRIGELDIAVVKFQDSKVVKFTCRETSLYFKFETLSTLFNLKYCIDNMYSWLCNNTHLVNDKFKNFVNIVKQNNVTQKSYAAQVISDSDDFNCNSLIDCELLACALPDIMYNALSE